MTNAVSEPVRALLELQEKTTLRLKKTAERDQMPPEVASLDADFQAKLSAVDELRERVASARTEKLEKERLHAEASERLQGGQTRSRDVRSDREYRAVLSEIDTARQTVRELDEKLDTLALQIEADESDLAEREKALPGERTSFEERIAGWREFQASCDAEIEALRKSIEALEKSLPKPLVSQFRQIFDRRNGIAVVRVGGDCCPACNVRLRPALLQILRLQSARQATFCEGCRRILFFDPDLVE